MLKKYNFNAIFFEHYDNGPDARKFLWERMKDPAWSLVYADVYAVILLKNTPENQDIINKFKITKENIEKKLSYLSESQDVNDKIAAGDLFNLMGREDLGIASFRKIVAKRPGESRVWLIMGQWALKQNDLSGPTLAITYLNKAIAYGEVTAEAYNLLGRAYFKTGQIENAKQTAETALKINPDYQDAKELFNQINLKLNQ